MSLYDARPLGDADNGAVRTAEPKVIGVLVHMEPYEN